MNEKQLLKEQLKSTVDIIDMDRLFEHYTSIERKHLIEVTLDTFSQLNKELINKESDKLIAEHKKIIRDLGR
ncbi:hypothetical protein [Salinicoccus albus]|uniref:hypothetical protein n=1 Tax=Salinicoccus albus TaxID=418756 RepID=UPI00036F7488|nr:hypothetical protein [Salinicoccus albus]